MPRPYIGPRLWMDEPRGTWTILDGPKRIRTGAQEQFAAQESLDEYLRANPGKPARALPVVGFVYFITADYPDYPIKIGFTQKREGGRPKDLQTGCPYRMVLLGIFPGGYRDERSFHKRFSEQRLEGEWFARSPELMALIETIKATH